MFETLEMSVKAKYASRLGVSRLGGKIQSQISQKRKSSFFIWGDFKHQKWIPGKILILLDPHNLSLHQNLPFLDLPKMCKNGNWQWQLANMAMQYLVNIWCTYKLWGSKSIRILPGIHFWSLKSPQTKFRVLKQTFTFLWYLALNLPF